MWNSPDPRQSLGVRIRLLPLSARGPAGAEMRPGGSLAAGPASRSASEHGLDHPLHTRFCFSPERGQGGAHAPPCSPRAWVQAVVLSILQGTFKMQIRGESARVRWGSLGICTLTSHGSLGTWRSPFWTQVLGKGGLTLNLLPLPPGASLP